MGAFVSVDRAGCAGPGGDVYESDQVSGGDDGESKEGDAGMSENGETIIIDTKTGGAKGQKPERFDLIPMAALEEVARVYGMGAKKYDDYNWLKGYKWSLSFGAMLRHISLWMMGQSTDKESGLHHLAHAAWHCLTLMSFELYQLGSDDRINRVLEKIRRDQDKQVREAVP